MSAPSIAATTVYPGRIVVQERALRAVCRQAAARAFGVARSDVTLAVSAAAGALALRVEAPLPVPALDDTAAITAGADVVSRVREIQRTVAEQVTALAGRDVARIDVVVTGAVVRRPRRVR